MMLISRGRFSSDVEFQAIQGAGRNVGARGVSAVTRRRDRREPPRAGDGAVYVRGGRPILREFSVRLREGLGRQDFFARMRRTEVRPIVNRRAISELLMPARCSFRTWSAWSPAVPVGPVSSRSVEHEPSQPAPVLSGSRARTRQTRPTIRPLLDRLVLSDPGLPSVKRNRLRG